MISLVRPILLCLGLLAAASYAQTPYDHLKKSMDARDSTAVVLIQSQLPSLHAKDAVVMKVEYNGLGGWRRSVLQPLRLQGTSSMSDGKFMTMVIPGDKAVFRMPVMDTQSRARRIELVRQNFKAMRDGSTPIAGRTALRFTFFSRWRGIPGRRIALDTETHFMLRSEVPQPGKKLVRLLDTMNAEFFANPLPTLIDFGVPSGYKLQMQAARIRANSLQLARRHVNFDVVSPEKLPFGLEIESVEVISGGSKGVLAIRLTDGFNSVVVYQWAPTTQPTIVGGENRTAAGENERAKFLAAGDLEVTDLAKIVDAFVKAPGTKQD